MLSGVLPSMPSAASGCAYLTARAISRTRRAWSAARAFALWIGGALAMTRPLRRPVDRASASLGRNVGLLAIRALLREAAGFPAFFAVEGRPPRRRESLLASCLSMSSDDIPSHRRSSVQKVSPRVCDSGLSLPSGTRHQLLLEWSTFNRSSQGCVNTLTFPRQAFTTPAPDPHARPP